RVTDGSLRLASLHFVPLFPKRRLPQIAPVAQSANSVTTLPGTTVVIVRAMTPSTADTLASRASLCLNAAASLRLIGPTASDSALLIRMLCDANAAGDELSLQIERDPILCAQVLKVANSPFYGQQRAVGTVRRALLVLGVHAVRGIAAAACVAQIVPPRVP